MSDREYDNLFHELYELSKNDMAGMNAGRTTQEHYFGYLCWQAATKAAEAKLSNQEPVGEVAGWEDEDGNLPVKWFDTPNVGTKLYTSPQAQPDLQAKLLQAEAQIKVLTDWLLVG